MSLPFENSRAGKLWKRRRRGLLETPQWTLYASTSHSRLAIRLTEDGNEKEEWLWFEQCILGSISLLIYSFTFEMRTWDVKNRRLGWWLKLTIKSTPLKESEWLVTLHDSNFRQPIGCSGTKDLKLRASPLAVQINTVNFYFKTEHNQIRCQEITECQC